MSSPETSAVGVGVISQDRAQQVAPGDAVGHAVVGNRDDRPLVLRQPVDHPDLPERTIPVEGNCHQLCDEGVQLSHLGGGEPHVSNVVDQIESGIIDPDRTSHRSARFAHALPASGDGSHPPSYECDHLIDRRHRSVEDAHRTDVHRVARVFDGEEHRIQAAHPLDHRRHDHPLLVQPMMARDGRRRADGTLRSGGVISVTARVR
jgi:hypothetical protein